MGLFSEKSKIESILKAERNKVLTNLQNEITLICVDGCEKQLTFANKLGYRNACIEISKKLEELRLKNWEPG